MNQGILEEFKNAFNKPNNELIQIILINVSIFVLLKIIQVLLTLSGAQDIYYLILNQLMLPSSLHGLIFKPWTMVTYFFTHEGFFHIIFNMLFLYWFGKLIVEYMGSKKLVSLYIIGGLAGGIFFIIIYNLLPVFQDRVTTSVMLGASAGVFAVVVGAATLMPNFTFFLLLLGPVRIKYIALFYVFLSFAQTIGANAGGELAHLGGAFIGYIYIRQLQKGNDIGTWVIVSLQYLQSFFVRRSKIKVTHKSSGRMSTRTKQTMTSTRQEEIDAILDKISQSGYESLSKEEKQKLFNASKK